MSRSEAVLDVTPRRQLPGDRERPEPDRQTHRQCQRTGEGADQQEEYVGGYPQLLEGDDDTDQQDHR